MPALFYVRTAALPTASRVPRRRARSLQARSPFAFTRRSDPPALSERAANYVAQGKNGMARKDLERILAEDSTFEGVRERLADLAE
jgi:hypothetical protein